MKRLARAAILTTMADELRKRDSWTGETHLQKSTYLLQVGTGVPLEYNFILYKHGPFAFDLRDEITQVRFDGLLNLEPQSYPYGPRLSTTQAGHQLQSKFPKTLGRYAGAIRSVADLVDRRGVSDLERLGTALFMLREDPFAEDDQLIESIRSVKPHVSESDAESAVIEIRSFLGAVEAKAVH